MLYPVELQAQVLADVAAARPGTQRQAREELPPCPRIILPRPPQPTSPPGLPTGEELVVQKNAGGTAYQEGLKRNQAGKSKEAIFYFNEAIRQNPGFADAYHDRGSARRYTGDPDGALADYSKAIQQFGRERCAGKKGSRMAKKGLKTWVRAWPG